MKKNVLIAIIVTLAFALTGCTSTSGPNEQTGMVIGGVLGGVLGHEVGGGHGKTAATILGTLAGAAIGGSIGRSMDEVDRMKVGATLENVRTGVTTSWKNPDTNYEYSMTPTRTYETQTGPCREYTLDAKIGGDDQQVYGTACRQTDGSWKIMQ